MSHLRVAVKERCVLSSNLFSFPASDVVSFGGDGVSGLMFRPSAGLKQKSKEVVSLEFKTMKNSGMLLHAEGQHGFSLSLELERGKLLLLLRQGTTSQNGYFSR